MKSSLTWKVAQRLVSRPSAQTSVAARNRLVGRAYGSVPVYIPPSLPKDPQPSAGIGRESQPQQPKGLLSKLWSRYSLSGQQRKIQIAEQFFQAATHQASDPRWFGPGRVSRDFRPRHALLTMHIWFLHKRLIADAADKDQALMIQEELFNILWEDTMCRIRREGINELLVNKNLLKVQQYTFLHLTHYDHAYTEFFDEPEERLKELRRIVWQHILIRDEDAEKRTDHLDRIAWYIEANYQNILMEWPDEYYRQGRVAWVHLPDFDDMCDADGRALPENPMHQDDLLPDGWRGNITLKGIDYYWNVKTREASWEKPTVT